MASDARDPVAHALHVSTTERAQRRGTAAWVDDELAFGAKVYYKGWLPDARPERHWLAGPEATPRTRAALRSGQLEVLDFRQVIEICGGTSAGLFELQSDEVARAARDGFPSVAMTQESARRELADDAEVAEFAQQEGGYDTLAAQAPLRVLCQLTTSVENEVHVIESLGIHHRAVVDEGWGGTVSGPVWSLRGDLDAHVALRFGSALGGALRAAGERGTDLHVDLEAVEFVDVACAELVVLVARGAAPGQQVVLHRPPRPLRRLLAALERPAAVVISEEPAS